MLFYYLTLLSIQPPVYCLMATVKEAKGILGKDISGEFLPFPYREGVITFQWCDDWDSF